MTKRNKPGQFGRVFLFVAEFENLEYDRNTPNSCKFGYFERHFSDRIINEAEKLGIKVARDKNGIGVIESEDYGEFKKNCNEIVSRGLQNLDILYCRPFIENMLAMI